MFPESRIGSSQAMVATPSHFRISAVPSNHVGPQALEFLDSIALLVDVTWLLLKSSATTWIVIFQIWTVTWKAAGILAHKSGVSLEVFLYLADRSSFIRTLVCLVRSSDRLHIPANSSNFL